MTENREEDGERGPSTRPVRFRIMRVETDFRRQTQRLDRKERDNYSSTIWNLMRLERKPKVSIQDMLGTNLDNPLGYEHEIPFKMTLDHYQRKSDPTELLQVLKFYCAYLMQQARKEPDFARQLFLAFKTVDFARTIIQFSTWTANKDAETLVWGIFYDLGVQHTERFDNYMMTERVIYELMKKVQLMPGDLVLRGELAARYVQQTSFFDGLVQYHYLLERFPRMPRQVDVRRGRTYIKIAEIFQNLAAHAERGGMQYRDARKIKNFIERYNRSYAGRGEGIAQLQGSQPSQLKKTERSLRAVANNWYMRAMAVRSLNPKVITDLALGLASNYLKDARAKDAMKLMREAYPYWHRVPDEVPAMRDRLEYLNMVVAIGMRLRARGTVEWANRELRDYEGKLREIELNQEKVDRVKDTLRGGGELEV